MYAADHDGILGRVVSLGGPIANGTHYVLGKTGGTGQISLQASFYLSVDGALGQPCKHAFFTSDGAGGETGEIDCGDANGDGVINSADRARFAVVVNGNAGVDAAFHLTW